MKFFSSVPVLFTCAFASNPFNRLSNSSSKSAAETYDFSSLASYKDIRHEAAGLIEAFEAVIAEVPEKRYQKVASTKAQHDLVSTMAAEALEFIPSESEARQKMEEIYKSFNEFMINENSKKDDGKLARKEKSRKRGVEHVAYCVQAFKDIMSVIKSINLLELRFNNLYMLLTFSLIFPSNSKLIGKKSPFLKRNCKRWIVALHICILKTLTKTGKMSKRCISPIQRTC